MKISKDVSGELFLEDRINLMIRQKKDENLALKKLLVALERAKQPVKNGKSEKN